MNLLQVLALDVRNRLIRQLEKSTDDEMLTPAPGLQNHFTWHAGHCLWVCDRLIIEANTGTSELPAGWGETYGMQCRSPSETTEWATRAELISLLTKQRDRLVELLAGDVEPGEAGVENWRENKTLRATHALLDEASHQGEIQVLRKWQRAGAAGKA